MIFGWLWVLFFQFEKHTHTEKHFRGYKSEGPPAKLEESRPSMHIRQKAKTVEKASPPTTMTAFLTIIG